MPLTGPAELLAAAVRREPAAPLVTHYDDATGERVELSATTLANWVAKTANLLQGEFDVAPGSTVAIALPVHWQTAAVLLGAWSCGAAVLDTAAEDDDRLAGADVVLAAADRLAPLEELALDELVGLSLHPLGPGLLIGGLQLSLAGLVDAAHELAARLGLVEGDRVMVDADTAAQAGPAAWLLAPLAAGASVVVCRHPFAERLPARAEQERVTATLGLEIKGVRELGRTT